MECHIKFYKYCGVVGHDTCCALALHLHTDRPSGDTACKCPSCVVCVAGWELRVTCCTTLSLWSTERVVLFGGSAESPVRCCSLTQARSVSDYQKVLRISNKFIASSLTNLSFTVLLLARTRAQSSFLCVLETSTRH